MRARNSGQCWRLVVAPEAPVRILGMRPPGLHPWPPWYSSRQRPSVTQTRAPQTNLSAVARWLEVLSASGSR